MSLGQSLVVGVPGVHEGMSALFDPTLEIRGGDAVRPGEDGAPRLQELDRVAFIHHLLWIAGKTNGIRAVVVVVLAAVVLNNENSTLLHIVEHAAVRSSELRTSSIRANAEDDHIVGGKIACVDVRRL